MVDNLEQLSELFFEDFGIEVDLHLEIRNGKTYLKSSEIHFVDLGIFGYALKNCVLDSFNSISLVEGKYILSDLHLIYEHIGGGSNGCSLGRSYLYDPESKNWERGLVCV